jgi:hypothetical protein
MRRYLIHPLVSSDSIRFDISRFGLSPHGACEPPSRLHDSASLQTIDTVFFMNGRIES